ncbi:hypothetical protein M0R45_036020 [Rubus argutus]|uniref:NADH dehydrogenase subunit 6 n=1 Tax=Rubus argutus TaxID=59490 RepID=A0AAW1VYJ9_RUBAR
MGSPSSMVSSIMEMSTGSDLVLEFGYGLGFMVVAEVLVNWICARAGEEGTMAGRLIWGSAQLGLVIEVGLVAEVWVLMWAEMVWFSCGRELM